MDAYKHFVSKPFDSPSDSEMVSILFEEDWLRVFMIKRENTPDVISIEVEISFPMELNSDEIIDSSNNLVKNAAQKAIKHLEYLLYLSDYGYEIGVIGESCLWTALRQSTNSLTSEDFEILLAFQNKHN